MYKPITSSRCRLKEYKNRKKNYCRTMSHIHIILRGFLFYIYFLAKSKNKGWQIWFISKMERLTAYIVEQTTKNNIKHIKFIFITNVINKIKSFKTSYIYAKGDMFVSFFFLFTIKICLPVGCSTTFFLFILCRWIYGFGYTCLFRFHITVIARQNIICHQFVVGFWDGCLFKSLSWLYICNFFWKTDKDSIAIFGFVSKLASF